MANKLNDKQRKKIIADYIQSQNYRETGRINNVSYATVKRLVKESDMNVSQKITQKQENNTQTTLEYMDSQHSRKREIVQKLLGAIETKTETVDMFSNAKDYATAYGIIVDKELKYEELKLKKKDAELRQRELNLNEELKDKRIQIPAADIGKAFVDINRSIDNREYLEYWFEGGRGSLKSSYVSEKAIELLYNNPTMCMMAIRKVKDTLKDSIYAQLQWAIQKLNLSHEFTCTKNPMEITRKATGQKIFFRGADDPYKIKSTKPPSNMYIGIVVYEEFDQMNGMEEVRIINQSIIRGGEDFIMFYCYNVPRSQQHFVNREKIKPKPNRIVHHSTYLQAPTEWLGQIFKTEAEMLMQTNKNAYLHEYMGKAVGIGGNVFENVTIRKITDEEIKTFDWLYYGNDWGYYPDPNHFGGMYYNSSQRKLYIFLEVRCWKTKNIDYAEKLKAYKNVRITADSADVKSIADFRDYGFDMRGAIKGPGSIEYGTKWLQSLNEIIIDNIRCPYTAEEFLNYEYLRDKDGAVISGYPDKDNHSIDMVRYAMEEVWRRKGQ